MFNLPTMLLVTVSSGTVSGTLEWPALAAVLVWLVILSLLCASVGLFRLRDDHDGSAQPGKPDGRAARSDLPVHQLHRKAA